jgi:hypothetical protein
MQDSRVQDQYTALVNLVAALTNSGAQTLQNGRQVIEAFHEARSLIDHADVTAAIARQSNVHKWACDGWIDARGNMPPRDEPVLMVRRGTMQIPLWHWKPIDPRALHAFDSSLEACKQFKVGDYVQVGPDECATFGTIVHIGTERAGVQYDHGPKREPLLSILRHAQKPTTGVR